MKQVRFGKLAFLQQNGAVFGPKKRRFRGGGGICIGRLHFDLRNLNVQIGISFGNLLVWLAPDSLILCFGGDFSRFGISDFSRFGISTLYAMVKFLRETGLIGQE